MCQPFGNRNPVDVGPAYCGFASDFGSSAIKLDAKPRKIVARQSDLFILILVGVTSKTDGSKNTVQDQ